MSNVIIRMASPTNKDSKKNNKNEHNKNKQNKKNNKKLWIKASHSVQDISHWKNSESSAREFTAKASYRILMPDNNIKIRGECINIDRNETVSKIICGEKMSNFLLFLSHNNYKYINIIFNILGFLIGIMILLNILPSYLSYPIGIFWILLPIQIFLTANRNIIWRIWRKSIVPYLQLYMSLTETWAFCDLCAWDERIMIVGTPMLLNQVMIINSDAVYFTKKDKHMILIQAFISILWKLILLFCLRFGYFDNMHPRKMITLMIAPQEFYLNNISVYASKTTSMIILLTGQIIFRIRHPEQAYSLRTHYTIRSNREWNNMNRKNRIQRKKTLKSDVTYTRDFLEEVIV